MEARREGKHNDERNLPPRYITPLWLNNSASFQEHRTGAEEILAKELASGWLEWSPTKGPLEKKYGQITQNRIGVFSKYKDNKQKLRLIHDLKRSGVNSKVQFSERLVLPRLADARDDVLHAIAEAGHENWECAVLDHADAFKQLRVEEKERCFLGGQALNGCFVYGCVLFGVKSGPLVWGRNAALMMRITSAMTKDRARMQCFVDDPLITVWGAIAQRNYTLLSIIVLWLAIGCRLSWSKDCRGRQVEWIGAVIQQWLTATGVPGVTFTITKEKIVKLAAQCDEILQAQSLVEKAKVRQLAGLATWVAGILPQITVYIARLWAATATAHNYIVAQQNWLQLSWLRALCGENLEPIQHHCRAPSGYFSLITFDAALTGGGATLQAGLPLLEQATSKPILAYWHARWTEEELHKIRVKPGDPSGQAALEA